MACRSSRSRRQVCCNWRWPTLGSIYVDSALTTSGTSGLNMNNQLDIYSDTYFINGYNNMAVTVKATQIP